MSSTKSRLVLAELIVNVDCSNLVLAAFLSVCRIILPYCSSFFRFSLIICDIFLLFFLTKRAHSIGYILRINQTAITYQ